MNSTLNKILKKVFRTTIKVGVLILLLALLGFLDDLMGYDDNPIILSLAILCWVWFVYILFPSFIARHLKLIVLYFGTLLLVWTLLRLFSDDHEAFLKIRSEIFLVPLLIGVPPILGIGLSIYDQWKLVQTLKSGKRDAELSLLRSQINPHFFFNTLNNLYALTITKSDKAPEVILKLSDMMRYTIYEGEKETVKLSDEITYLENYIELHKIRYKNPNDILFNHSVEADLNVAPLLFIILLENAFKHGVESAVENAFIHINLYEDGNYICFDIENNFNPTDESESTGIGLDNLKKRLSLLYKGKHEYTSLVEDDIFKVKLKISKDA